MKTSILIVFALIFSSCNDIFNSDDNVNIRKVVYESVQIGEQVWMSRNLDVTHYRNGDPIPYIPDSADWVNLKTGAWCYFGNLAEHDSAFGKLYNWYAVNDPRGLAPKGWKIPSDDDWNELELYLGQDPEFVNKIGFRGNPIAQKICGGYDYWYEGKLRDHPEFNITGFNGLPGGARGYDGVFYDFHFFVYWWTSTEYNDRQAYRRRIKHEYLDISRFHDQKDRAFSVRCIKK